MMLPVFLFTGFLDSGKTTFIQSMLEDSGFNEGQRTLVILCEEGEEELDPSRFSINNVTIRTVADQSELTQGNMILWGRKAAASRIMIEYNGMWQMNDLFDRLPENWGIAQETMMVDASTIAAFNANMRQLVVDKLNTAELVIFTRVEPEQDKMELHKLVRGISRGAQIVYDLTDGTSVEDDIEDPLPFDLNADIVEIADRDYALFYRDLVDEPAKYEGKTVRYKGLCANNMRMPKDTFLAGRHIMTCCEADIAYCPLVCKWDMAKSVKHKGWGIVEGTIHEKFSNIYGKKGPVLTIHSFEPATEPEQPVATFY
ncbi:MAG: GTP-binding protein [Clostridia bacterium]|nr:GTP-binding protein [Clostridia bacterium]